MNDFNQADRDGCLYTMYVLSEYFSTPVQWEHTSTSQADEYCEYDMDWSATVNGKQVEYCVENKDRRFNVKTGDEQYYGTYDSIMFNPEKYEYLMKRWNEEGKVPIFTSDYADGVFFLDCRNIPSPVEQFIEERTFNKYTYKDSYIKKQIRLMIPKQYGRFYPKPVK